MEVNVEKLEMEFGVEIGQKLLVEMQDGSKMATVFAIMLGAVIDALDFLLVGQVPVIGTAIKLIGTTALTVILWNVGGFIKWKVRGLLWAGTALEIIPVVATLPIYTLSMIWVYFKIKKRAGQAEEQVQEYIKITA